MKGRRKNIRVEKKYPKPLKFDVNRMKAYYYESMKSIEWEIRT